MNQYHIRWGMDKVFGDKFEEGRRARRRESIRLFEDSDQNWEEQPLPDGPMIDLLVLLHSLRLQQFPQTATRFLIALHLDQNNRMGGGRRPHPKNLATKQVGNFFYEEATRGRSASHQR